MERLRTVCGKCKKFLFVPEYKATEYPEADLNDKITDHLKFHCSSRREFYEKDDEHESDLLAYVDELLEAAK